MDSESGCKTLHFFAAAAAADDADAANVPAFKYVSRTMCILKLGTSDCCMLFACRRLGPILAQPLHSEPSLGVWPSVTGSQNVTDVFSRALKLDQRDIELGLDTPAFDVELWAMALFAMTIPHSKTRGHPPYLGSTKPIFQNSDPFGTAELAGNNTLQNFHTITNMSSRSVVIVAIASGTVFVSQKPGH